MKDASGLKTWGRSSMVSTGSDQFWADSKPENSVVTPKKKRTIAYSQISSMSSPQSTTVTKTSGVATPGMQDAAKRRLKKLQQQNDTDNRF